MLSGGGKNIKIKAVYFIFPLNPHSSGKAESWQPWAMKRRRVKLAPMQTTDTGLVQKFLRIDTLLQV